MHELLTTAAEQKRPSPNRERLRRLQRSTAHHSPWRTYKVKPRNVLLRALACTVLIMQLRAGAAGAAGIRGAGRGLTSGVAAAR
jgi:hypothetical protein